MWLRVGAVGVLMAACASATPTRPSVGVSAPRDEAIYREPVDIDAQEPRDAPYLEEIRARIKRKWTYPCVMNEVTWDCEYKTVSLVLNFGVAKSGKLTFVTVTQSSGFPIYDQYAVDAVKAAAPFPPIPDSFSKTDTPIQATFNYVVKPRSQ